MPKQANFILVHGMGGGACFWYEIITLLDQLDATKQSAVLSEKLGDLCIAQGKPSSAVHAYLQALELEPSPQQRVRITLSLGPKLVALNREPEAYEVGAAVLRPMREDFADLGDWRGFIEWL